MRRFRLVLIVTGLLLGSFGVSAAQSPELDVTSPTDGSTIDGTNVTVTFDVSGISIVDSPVPVEQAGLQPEANQPGEGHLHLMLDLGSLVVWTIAEPYTFTNVPPGEHQLMVEIVNNDHSSLDPPVVRQVRFRTSASQVLPNTGEARQNDTSTYAGLLALSGLVMLGAGVMLRRRFA